LVSQWQEFVMAQTPPETTDHLLREQAEENLEFLRRLRRHALEQLRKVAASSPHGRNPKET
jgi:hypothetical protein